MPVFLVGVLLGLAILKVFGQGALLAFVGGLLGSLFGLFSCSILSIIWPETFWSGGAFIWFVGGGGVLGALKGLSNA